MVEPISFLSALRRGWRLLVACAALLAIILVVIPVPAPSANANQPYHWQAWAIVGSPPSNGLFGSTVTTSQILFYADSFQVKTDAILTSKAVGDYGPLVYGMNASTSPPKSSASATATTAAPGAATAASKHSATGNVYLTALEASPTRAAALANAYATALGNKLTLEAENHAIATTKSNGTTPSTVTGFEVILPAAASTSFKIPGSSTSFLNSRKVRLVLGLLGGALVGALLILLREVTDKRFRKASRVEVHFKYPVIAEINEYPWRPGFPEPSAMAVVDYPDSQIAEAYRKLRNSILFEQLAPVITGRPGLLGGDPMSELDVAQREYEIPGEGTRKVVLVLSPGDEPSRSVLVANLAATYAEAGERAVVINAGDIESGLQRGPAPEVEEPTLERLGAELRPTALPSVSTLSLRPFIANSSQLVSRAEPVLSVAREMADVVIIEAPALLAYHHGEALLHVADVVVIVSEYLDTTTTEADQSGDIMRRLGAPVLGVAFCQVPMARKVQRAMLAEQREIMEQERARARAEAAEHLESTAEEHDVLEPADS